MHRGPMTIGWKIALVAMAYLLIFLGLQAWRGPNRDGTSTSAAPTAKPLPSRILETSHYTISSTATVAQTQLVADAVESLHAAYSSFFSESITVDVGRLKLKLVLYGSREEFRANNRSSPWAEAYYLAPSCHAYFSSDNANPYHWMLHEATHQLNGEVAHFRKVKWMNEGLASYFGTSRIDGRRLLPGSIDVNTYPVWWLAGMTLTGNIGEDIESGRIIPLAAIVSGTGGPDIDANFNLYYIEYWSLSHFLFHYRNGKYAGKYRELIRAGGSLQDFERLIGPMDRVQKEWHGYLREKVAEVRQMAAAS